MEAIEKSHITEEIKAQIIEIRDSGQSNMFDVVRVQRIAYENELYELVCFIQDHRNEYVKFILEGDRE